MLSFLFVSKLFIFSFLSQFPPFASLPYFTTDYLPTFSPLPFNFLFSFYFLPTYFPPYFSFLFFITRRKLAQNVNASLAPDDSCKQHQYLRKKHNKSFDISLGQPSTSVFYHRLHPSWRYVARQATQRRWWASLNCTRTTAAAARQATLLRWWTCLLYTSPSPRD